MGLLVDGRWHDTWYDTDKTKGEFVRTESQFRHWITADGSPGDSGAGGFPAAAGRYHLFVSRACPWAHRTLILRQLKGLQNLIGVTRVKPLMLEHGWEMAADAALTSPVKGLTYLYELYLHARPDYSGRVTVPVLWDCERDTIVNNESAEIIRMFNSAFDGLVPPSPDYYPAPQRAEIDRLNRWIYQGVNNAVYRAGFATSAAAYERAYDELFATLDALEARLEDRRYLTGAMPSEADWRLFTTLIRFDAVYVGHFKTNRQRIEDYPNLSNYLRDLYQLPGIAATVDFDEIKTHYYASHRQINPSGIIPKGPLLDYNRPHDRDRCSG
ncbi:MAG: glutathione S-transferase family protein [Pelovirga sp.]